MTEIKLKSLIAKQFGLPVDNIGINTSLVGDLNADSLDLVEIVMNIEREFNIKIEDTEYVDADTVDKIIKLINSKLVG